MPSDDEESQSSARKKKSKRNFGVNSKERLASLYQLPSI